MSSQKSFPITTLSGPNTAIFAEATPAQQLLCKQLGATAFAPPLPEEEYVHREEHMARQSLAQNGGLRIWLVHLANDPYNIIGTCKTIHRDLLVREGESREVMKEKGYVVGGVVTDKRYRGQGIASFLLDGVKDWLDAEGAVASMIYCSTSLQEFYAIRGWKPISTLQSVLFLPATPSYTETYSSLNLPPARLLKHDDLSELCERDIESILTSSRSRTDIASDTTLIAPLPATELVTWRHARSQFISQKLLNKDTQIQGAICDEANVWMYWYHDIRRQRLCIQRLRLPSHGESAHQQEDDLSIASLFLAAIIEAQEWGITQIVVWERSSYAEIAMAYIAKGLNLEWISERNIEGENLGTRWKDGEVGRKIVVEPNEIYAWG